LLQLGKNDGLETIIFLGIEIGLVCMFQQVKKDDENADYFWRTLQKVSDVFGIKVREPFG